MEGRKVLSLQPVTSVFCFFSGMRLSHSRDFSRSLLIVTVSLRIFDQPRSSLRVCQSPLFYLGSSRRRDFLAPRLISAHHFVSLAWEGSRSRKGSRARITIDEDIAREGRGQEIQDGGREGKDKPTANQRGRSRGLFLSTER